MRINRNRWIAIALTGSLLLAGLVQSQSYDAPTGNLATQLATAIQHSGFSASAGEHAMAVRHLGHVLNCLAGEGGAGFDASWGNPCGGQGAGIVNDIASHPQGADLAILVSAAHALATDGVGQASLGAVQAAAAGVGALLSVFGGN